MGEVKAPAELQGLVDKLKAAREKENELKQKHDEAKVAEKQAESNLFQAMDEADLDSAKLESGVTIMLRRTLYASCTKAHLEELKQRFKDYDLLPEGIVETFHKGILNKHARTCVEEGIDIPQWLTFYVKEGITLKG